MSEPTITALQGAIINAQQSQKEMQAAQAELKRVRGLIEAQEQQILKLQSKKPDMAAINTMAEDMSAAEVMGTTTAAERRKFDAEANDAAEAAAAIEPQIDKCRRATGGLVREADALMGRIASLRATLEGRLSALVLAQAEELGAEYVQLAQHLRANYLRLLGLRQLSRHLGGNSAFTIERVLDMEVPAFGLEAFSGIRLHLYRDHIIKTGHTFNANTGMNSALQELAALEQHGITATWEELAPKARPEAKWDLQ